MAVQDPQGWQGWQIFIVSAGPAVVAWLFAAYQWWAGRKDRLRDIDLTYQQRLAADILEQRKTLNADQAMLFERIRADWARAYQRMDEIEEEKGRLWELVRYWYRYSESLLHKLRNQRVALEAVANRTTPPTLLAPWEDYPLPDMESPDKPTPPPPGTHGMGTGTLPPLPSSIKKE